MELVSKNLDVAFNAMSPLGVAVKFGKVSKRFSWTLADHGLLADLIMLTMSEFKVILGINWLTKFYANLDCVNKSITFTVLGSQPFTF